MSRADEQVAAAAQRASAAATELEAQRKATAIATQALADARAARPAATVALVLRPETRGAAPTSTISIAPGSSTVPLDLQFESDGHGIIRSRAQESGKQSGRVAQRDGDGTARATSRSRIGRCTGGAPQVTALRAGSLRTAERHLTRIRRQLRIRGGASVMRGTLSFTPAAISTLVGLLLSNPVTPSDSSIVDARPWLCNQEALQVADIARAYAAAGDIDHALVYQRRADAALEQQLSVCVAIGSERQKLAFVRAAAERTDRTISLAPHAGTRQSERGLACGARAAAAQRPSPGCHGGSLRLGVAASRRPRQSTADGSTAGVERGSGEDCLRQHATRRSRRARVGCPA